MLQLKDFILKMYMNNQHKKKRNKHTFQSRLPKILIKIEDLIQNWEEAKMTDTYLFFSNPKKAIWANMLIGISRGVGFVIGVSIIGVIVVTIIGSILSHFVTIPVIGEFIAMLVKSVQEYLGN